MKKLNVKSAFPVLFVAVLLTAFGGGRFAVAQDGSALECDWNPKDPHKMHWPQLPDMGSAGMDVDMSLLFLADDFKCMATGPINDIHIWCSFRDDVLPSDGPGSVTFEITIYSDIPATESSWSMPGELLWSRTFSPDEYSVRKLDDSPEAWYDPAKELYLPDNHRQVYQYNFCIEEAPFIQVRGTIYWLSVKELAPANANYKFGWKTTTHRLRWNDDAVYFLAGKLVSFPLKYPKDHEYMGESLDLAFVITDGEQGDRKHDLGDAPDSSNSFPGATMLAYPAPGVVANYPTVYEIGSPPYGPIHWRPDAMFHLGKTVTNEGEADIGYDEDIKNNLVPPDDLSDLDGGDDGVPLALVLPECQQATFDYTVNVLAPDLSMAVVNVWCDWNRDGDWDDVMVCPDGTTVPEWAVQNQQLLLMGPGTVTITTPPFMCWHTSKDAELDPMWMRITIAERLWGDTAGGVMPGGAGLVDGYEYGETEDYLIYPKKEGEPLEYDWGDAPTGTVAAGYPTIAFNNGANHVIAGPWLGDENDKPDSEPDGQPDTNALGDDNDGNDDENGVTIPPLIRGETADITLDVRGGGGIVRAWIDFNGDKTWQAAEQIYDGFLPSGAHAISFSVPTSAVLGQTFARFRISKQSGLGPEGLAPDGEVEDHNVFIEEVPNDLKWVQWPDLTRNGIDIRVDSSDGKYRGIADDFECTNNNRITNVSLWGSWKNDTKGVVKQIHLSIYPDDPAGPAGQDPENKFSKPGSEPLWDKYFGPNEFQEALYHVVRNPGEWWWDPGNGEYGPGGDSEVWRIDLYIESSEAFLQQGSLDSPVIYWLEVRVDTEDGEFGWKTRRWPDHYMDDAVCDVFFELQPNIWRELRYPKTHPYHTLEKNSIDMAFQLTYTEEGPPQPTTRPVSATQCPVVQTQCPTVATQCPPVNTRCPVVATQCPAVQTQCPAVETSCPPEPTKCPAVDTECPPEPTKCPVEETKCPESSTSCPVVQTQCPAGDTYCPISETRCPPEPTKCPPVPTQCPDDPTRCPPSDTQCPAVETECPPSETRCPPSRTTCPPVPTQCPVEQTICPESPTNCPVVQTQCPAGDTYCPISETRCPPEPTMCPPVPTQCPPKETECPPSETRCPPEPTMCPPLPTQCPVEKTKCPESPTNCPMVQTTCPSRVTECPAAPTRCPPAQTQCPLEPTMCPPVPTQCPVENTICPESPTNCPMMQTTCPSRVTECPAAPTRCPPAQTQCPVEQTICPESSTHCPPEETQCPAAETQCPPNETSCPRESTKCPPVETLCPVEPTVCPVEETKCPESSTKCPPVDTQCPLSETVCPPVETKCPEKETTCPAEQTKCPVDPTWCPPVETECPFDPTQPCQVTIFPQEPTFCPAAEPTQCPDMTTQCPMETLCPTPESQCPDPSGMCGPGGLGTSAMGTRYSPVMAQCPAIDVQCPTVVPQLLLAKARR